MVPTEQQPFPSSQEDHLSPSETRRTGSGSLQWPTLPKKSSPGLRSWRARVVFLPLHFASASAMSHPPISCPTHGCFFQPSFWGGVGWPGTKEWPSAQQQLGLMGDRKELSASHKQDSSWHTGPGEKSPRKRTADTHFNPRLLLSLMIAAPLGDH